MNIPDLRALASHARSMREAGITLLLASALLSLFLFVPMGSKPAAPVITVEAPAAPDAFADIPLSATAAIVYDLATDAVLYEKNASTQLPLASLTKLLTVYAAVTTLPPTASVVIPEHALSVEAPRAFNAGQVFLLSDLARLTLTASLNDGAAAIANAVAKYQNRSEREMLASVAAALELTQTYAVNGNGLDVTSAVSGAYGSAEDLARLAGALVARAPDIAFATTRATAEASSAGGTAYSVKNTDPIVNTIPRLLLSKTGYTDLAGGNLVIVFDAAFDHPIAVVVLGSSFTDRFTDASALIAASFAHFAGLSSLSS